MQFAVISEEDEKALFEEEKCRERDVNVVCDSDHSDVEG